MARLLKEDLRRGRCSVVRDPWKAGRRGLEVLSPDVVTRRSNFRGFARTGEEVETAFSL